MAPALFWKKSIWPMLNLLWFCPLKKGISFSWVAKCCPTFEICFVSFRSLYCGCLCSTFEFNLLQTQVTPLLFPSDSWESVFSDPFCSSNQTNLKLSLRTTSPTFHSQLFLQRPRKWLRLILEQPLPWTQAELCSGPQQDAELLVQWYYCRRF